MTTDGVFTETQCRRLDTDSTQTRGCFSGITTISFQPRLPAVGRSATLGEVEAGLCRRFQDHVHADCLRMVCVMRSVSLERFVQVIRKLGTAITFLRTREHLEIYKTELLLLTDFKKNFFLPTSKTNFE
ncbi:uncharacterized protein LOC116843776 isoform X3 [Odontomachus brunneus]|uniref:uncharacterized protein LOC116843776 isoform X3 n=1 Tax=Odontomachus brunneus TaxID=486640 RepID=UPI0013F2589B|nr:uncharacterized protein LOC116843776 isoform X3 [Odontomachus brunneus]